MSKKTREAFRQGQIQNHMATPRVPEGQLLNREPENVSPALDALGAKPVAQKTIYVEDSKCPKCGCPSSRLFRTSPIEDGRITWRGCKSCLHQYQGFDRTWRKK